MNKLNDLKNWIKPRWRKFVRYLNRLDADIQRSKRARGGSGKFVGATTQDFPAAFETKFTDTLGPNSPNVSIRIGYPSYRDHLDG
jgi:hypothetical protein